MAAVSTANRPKIEVQLGCERKPGGHGGHRKWLMDFEIFRHDTAPEAGDAVGRLKNYAEFSWKIP